MNKQKNIEMDYKQLFGETLSSKNGTVDVSQLKGKVVGLYFSYFVNELV